MKIRSILLGSMAAAVLTISGAFAAENVSTLKWGIQIAAGPSNMLDNTKLPASDGNAVMMVLANDADTSCSTFGAGGATVDLGPLGRQMAVGANGWTGSATTIAAPGCADLNHMAGRLTLG